MNEWSPGGNYSRPGTPNQSGRSFRSQWEETEKGTKPLIVNIRAVSDKSKSQQQQHSLDNVTKSSISIASKNKKNGADGSDPRFKRVIQNGLQNDACVGTDRKESKKRILVSPAKDLGKVTNLTLAGSGDTKIDLRLDDMETMDNEGAKSDDVEQETKTPAHVEPEINTEADHPKGADTPIFNENIIKSLSKESFSNCTVNTLNTSSDLASDDLLEDIPNDFTMVPSPTRVKKVQNWMMDQKPKMEKKQSVITVIGQTQGRDTVSSALQEIDKRRKLVKELDKYAMCKKIIETEKGKDVSEVVARITALSPVDRRGKDGRDDPKSRPSSRKGSSDMAVKNEDKTEKVMVLLNNDIRTESLSLGGHKRSLSKKKCRKNHLGSSDCLIKGKLHAIFNRLQYKWLFYVVFLISGIICWITFLSLHKGSYVSFDFFTKKPKTMTWYEKICMWLWELFRPSSNYKRSTPWNY